MKYLVTPNIKSILNSRETSIQNDLVKAKTSNQECEKIKQSIIKSQEDIKSKSQKIISEAKNTDDPLGHAEMHAIRKATKKLKQDRLNGLDIYVTIEPCPMCAYAISKVNLTKVYFGCEDQKGGGIFNGVKVYSNSNIWKPEVISHVYESESRNLIQQFFKNKRKNKAL